MGEETRGILEIKSFIPEFPETGGFVFHIVGTKSPNDSVESVRMKIGGDEFWRSLGTVVPPQIVATFKLTLHPVVLSNEMLDLKGLKKGTTEVTTKIVIGTTGKYKPKKKSILKRVNNLIANGNPDLKLDFEVGEKRLLWKQTGKLFSFSTPLSVLLSAAEKGESLHRRCYPHSPDPPSLSPSPSIPIPVPASPTPPSSPSLIAPTSSTSPPKSPGESQPRAEFAKLSKKDIEGSLRVIVKVFPTVIDVNSFRQRTNTISERAIKNRITLLKDSTDTKTKDENIDEEVLSVVDKVAQDAAKELQELQTNTNTGEDAEKNSLSELLEQTLSTSELSLDFSENQRQSRKLEKIGQVKNSSGDLVLPQKLRPKEEVYRKWKIQQKDFDSKDKVSSFYKSNQNSEPNVQNSTLSQQSKSENKDIIDIKTDIKTELDPLGVALFPSDIKLTPEVKSSDKPTNKNTDKLKQENGSTNASNTSAQSSKSQSESGKSNASSDIKEEKIKKEKDKKSDKKDDQGEKKDKHKSKDPVDLLNKVTSIFDRNSKEEGSDKDNAKKGDRNSKMEDEKKDKGEEKKVDLLNKVTSIFDRNSKEEGSDKQQKEKEKEAKAKEKEKEAKAKEKEKEAKAKEKEKEAKAKGKEKEAKAKEKEKQQKLKEKQKEKEKAKKDKKK